MTSVDSNVIFSALAPHEANHAVARRLLREASEDGLVVVPVVYTELMASPNRVALTEFLLFSGIAVLWEMPPEVWERAGTAFGEYARVRRGGELPRRIAGDFLIAAHAEHHGLSVLTFDDTIFRAVFPKLRLI